MKKNIFALSVAAALATFAGSAAAQVAFLDDSSTAGTKFEVNHGGVGHILLAPYYTVQGSRNTLLNLVNTDTKNGKVVKIRFRGARNSDDVYDFHVFLSPGDVWRARVYRDGETTHLETKDSSCTLPETLDGTKFGTIRVFEQRESEVREGYVEVLTTANIPEKLVGTTTANPLYKATKHDSKGKVECTNSALTGATVHLSTEAAAYGVGLDYPTEGLIGQWAIVDVTTNSAVSGNTTAIRVVDGTGAAAKGNMVVAPQTDLAAPATVVAAGTTDPLLTGNKVTPLNFDFPDLSTPYLKGKTAADQANELSAALSVTRVMNEFTTGMGIDLKTDWVFSMPTRRYGVALDYAAGEAIQNPGSDFFKVTDTGSLPRVGTAPNVRLLKEGGIPTLSIDLKGHYFDNEERGLTATSVSPGTGQRLAGEVSVLTFNNPTTESVLGAEISAQRVNPRIGKESISEGWAYIDLTNAVATAASKSGYPVIGYATFTAGDKALGFTWPHRYSK